MRRGGLRLLPTLRLFSVRVDKKNLQLLTLLFNSKHICFVIAS